MDALSELEPVEFPAPVGTLEAFHTGGGISTMPFAYEGKVDVMEYKTLRYPGHVAIMRPIRELGLLDIKPVEVKGQTVVPRDLFIAAVSPQAAQAEGQGPRRAPGAWCRVRRAEARRESRFRLIDYYDGEHGISAMMRTTGYSLSITGQMQADGRVTAEGRAHPGRGDARSGPTSSELGKRGIRIEEL